MEHTKERGSYIVCGYALINDHDLSITDQPVLLYGDGTLEIQDIIKFEGSFLCKCGSCYSGILCKCASCYCTIRYHLERLGNSERDLRPDFTPVKHPEVEGLMPPPLLLRPPAMVRLPRALYHKYSIETSIYLVSQALYRKLMRRIRKALKQQSPEDLEFLKRIGY